MLTRLLSEGEAREKGFAEKIIDVLEKITQKIVAFFQTLAAEFDSNSEEAKFFLEQADKRENLRKMYDKALDKALQNARGVYGGRMTSK